MQKKKPRTVLFKTSLNLISILLRLCSVAQKTGVFKGKYQHIVIINQLIQAVLRGNNAHFCLLYSCFCHIACPQVNLRRTVICLCLCQRGLCRGNLCFHCGLPFPYRFLPFSDYALRCHNYIPVYWNPDAYSIHQHSFS